jgi:hypothetical protein
VKSLRSHLDNYKLNLDVNQELFAKNISTRDELAAKLAEAEVFINQSEQPGDEVDYFTALDTSTQIIVEIDSLIKTVRSQDTP